MSNRFAGVAYWYADGRQFSVRGNLNVMPSKVSREGIAGQDGVHGFKEMPTVPYIEGDVSLVEGTNVEDIDAITDATITARLANGSTYYLRNAWRAERSEINSNDGQFKLKFEGLSCDEVVA